MKTRILKVPLAGKDEDALGRWATAADGTRDLNTWEVPSSSSNTPSDSDPLAPLREAAHLLRTTDIPVNSSMQGRAQGGAAAAGGMGSGTTTRK